MTFIQDESNIKKLEQQVKDGKLAALIEVSDQNGQLHAEISTFQPLKLNDQSTISSLLQYAGQHYAVQKLSLTSEQAAQIMAAKTVISNKNLNAESMAEKRGRKAIRALGILCCRYFNLLLYFYFPINDYN
ncbi:Sodium ABC transporter permease OS=Lysinibacillus sphaericus OX=1421 GN=LS41612_14095 PE=4 SV=1 [Lysinibacillus sphaericus]